MRQSRLEVDEADSFIDRQPLDLREHRRVRGVEEIATVGVAGTQDANRRLELLHGADLHGRCVRPQQNVLAEVERVVQVERGVIGREIERREIVPLGFRFGAERNGESELAEDVFDFFDDERHRMLRAEPLPPCRHGEVDFSVRRARCLELPTPIVKDALELSLDGVDERARFP